MIQKLWNKNKVGIKNKLSFSIQSKLVCVFLCTSLVLFFVNIVIYININEMTAKIDKIYSSNVSINQLQEALDATQDNMAEYLNTKSSDAMEAYYRSEQDYSLLLEDLNSLTVKNDVLLMEKNIREMSLNYLELTSSTIDAKRGRNVEKYSLYYEQSTKLYSYLTTFIFSLNNEQFKFNSNNYEILLNSMRYSEMMNMVILIFVSILNILLIILLTSQITSPLKKLAETANRIAEGKLDVELVEVKTRDEVGVVTKAFNKMILSINQYIEKIKESMEKERAMKEKELMIETHLKDAQLKYLQAQINPHFLFNTLNAGAQLAMMENAEKTYTYIQNVADFFRYNVKKNKDTATLAEEIELVDNYVYILNVRFSGDIHFQKIIDERLTKIQIPSMILQPIVENCINYGIRGIDWQGLIELSVYRRDDNLCISIKDNGIGMSEELIEKVMKSRLKETDLSENSNGVGLDNVIGRLRLFFDREDVLKITSAGENKGTEVSILIPLECKDEDFYIKP